MVNESKLLRGLSLLERTLQSKEKNCVYGNGLKCLEYVVRGKWGDYNRDIRGILYCVYDEYCPLQDSEHRKQGDTFVRCLKTDYFNALRDKTRIKE